MTGLKAYTQQQQVTSWSRIDVLLALYDGAIDRVERALAALRSGDAPGAARLLARAQAIVLELAAGVVPEAGDPSSVNLLRLYEFFARALAGGDSATLESVLKSLTTLREGFRSIRPEAVRLERSGEIPPLDGPQQVLAVV